MRLAFLKILVAVVALAIAQGVLAQVLPPYSVFLKCDPAETVGNPPLEPFNGKSQVQMVYFGNETFCYRAKFKCDKEFSGGFDLTCFCEDMTEPPYFPADGGIGVGGFIDSGDGFCGMGGGHVNNKVFSHSCSYEHGDVRLRVEAVNGELCSDLPPPIIPSNCYFPKEGPGCDCEECETLVCGMDDFCCNGQWDQQCANLANDYCQGICPGTTGNY